MDNIPTFDDLNPPRRVCNTKNERYTFGHPRTDEAGLDHCSRKQDNNSERGIKRNYTGKYSHHSKAKKTYNRAQEDQEDQEDPAEKIKNDEEFMQWGRGYVCSWLWGSKDFQSGT